MDDKVADAGCIVGCGKDGVTVEFEPVGNSPWMLLGPGWLGFNGVFCGELMNESLGVGKDGSCGLLGLELPGATKLLLGANSGDGSVVEAGLLPGCAEGLGTGSMSPYPGKISRCSGSIGVGDGGVSTG